MPMASKRRRNWSSTTSANVPTTSRLLRGLGRGLRHLGDQGGEAGILALGEGRLDPRPGIVEHAKVGAEGAVETQRRARQVELDDLGRAGADEEQKLDVGPPLEQAGHDAVELLVGVRQAGEIALLQDGGGEARLGEDHDAGGGLHEMGAGARADDEEEGILDLAMQPDDAGEAAEDLALAALAQHRGVGAAAGRRGRESIHQAKPPAGAAAGAAP